MRAKDQERVIISQWLEIILIFIAVTSFVISLYTLADCFSQKKKIESLKYSYNIENQIDYKVYMFDNNFFDEKYLGMNKNYMSKLVNTINLNYNHSLNVSEISNIEYNYVVNATVKAQAQAENNFYDSIIWMKKYNLIPKTENQIIEKNKTNINIPLVIDYQTYKQLVMEFENQMRLDIDSYLEVQILVDYKFYVNGDKVEETVTSNVKIPLSNQTFKIDIEYDKNNEKKVFNDIELQSNNMKIAGGLILFFSSLFCCILLIAILVKDTQKAEYIIKLNKILKNYGDIMARVKKMPNIEEKEIYEIHDFVDLVNIEEELKIPIIYYEKRLNKEGWFLIIHFNIVYRYILREKDIQKTKK